MKQNGPTALVLSAGGMFGAYQAGVWKVLADVFKPDIVVGASVGSLNGWLIASGCHGYDLAREWMELQHLSRIRWRLPSSPGAGIIDSTALEHWIQTMCEGRTPRSRLGIVLTHLRTMHPRLFRWPNIRWEHVATSCAVPFFLRQYRIDGEAYSDGGLVDPLPLRAALEMGATRIVAINVLKHRPVLIRALVRAVRAYGSYSIPSCDGAGLIEVCPSGRLGSARESMYWSPDNTAAWIERGQRDAEAVRNLVVQFVSRDPHPDCSGGTEIVDISHPPPEREHPAAVSLGASHGGADNDQTERL